MLKFQHSKHETEPPKIRRVDSESYRKIVAQICRKPSLILSCSYIVIAALVPINTDQMQINGYPTAAATKMITRPMMYKKKPMQQKIPLPSSKYSLVSSNSARMTAGMSFSVKTKVRIPPSTTIPMTDSK